MMIAILDSLPVLISVFVVSCVLGALWILLMGAFVKVVVWATILFVPSASVFLSGWSIYLLFAPASIAQTFFLVFFTSFSVAAGTAFSIFAYLHKDKIETTIAVIQLATHVLRTNPSLFVMSLVILAGQLIFVVIWIVMTTQFVNLSSWASTLTPEEIGELSWILGVKWTPTLLFFTAMLIWTTCVFGNIHRMAVACVVHHWYFSRNLSRLSSQERAKRALVRATTTLFGTACCGALIEAFAIVVKAGIKLHQKTKKHVPSTPDFVVTIFSPFVLYVVRIAQVVNHHTLTYAAITSHSFLTSARAVGSLLSRALASAFLRDIFARATLTLGSAILCTCVGLGVITALRNDRNVDNIAPSSAAGIVFVSLWISWAIMRFWSSLLIHVVDATYLCFAIDVDHDQCHSSEAHTAFAKFRY
jgi:hypothetical protein